MMPTESFLLVDLVLCVLDVVAELLNDLRERFLRSKLLLLNLSLLLFEFIFQLGQHLQNTTRLRRLRVFLIMTIVELHMRAPHLRRSNERQSSEDAAL